MEGREARDGQLAAEIKYIEQCMNLVLITSVTHPSTARLSYSPTRSVFTPEERIEQLKLTIASVRRMVPDSYIVLLEGCETRGAFDVDHVCDQSGDPSVQGAIHGPSKGCGEASQILMYLGDDHFRTNKHQFRSVSKMSGRYELTEDFSFEETSSIVLHLAPSTLIHGPIFMHTTYYRIPVHLVDAFAEALRGMLCDERFRLGHVCIEELLFSSFAYRFPYLNKETLGVKGKVSVCGTQVRD